MEKEINARIIDTFLGIEHGCLTFQLFIGVENAEQAYGGYNISGYSGGPVIKKILETLEVEKWESLIGTYIRLIRLEDGKIKSIKHITKNKEIDLPIFIQGIKS